MCIHGVCDVYMCDIYVFFGICICMVTWFLCGYVVYIYIHTYIYIYIYIVFVARVCMWHMWCVGYMIYVVHMWYAYAVCGIWLCGWYVYVRVCVCVCVCVYIQIGRAHV